MVGLAARPQPACYHNHVGHQPLHAVSLHRPSRATATQQRLATFQTPGRLQPGASTVTSPETSAAEQLSLRLRQDNGQAPLPDSGADLTVLLPSDPEDYQLPAGELSFVDKDSPEVAADVFRCSDCSGAESKVSLPATVAWMCCYIQRLQA